MIIQNQIITIIESTLKKEGETNGKAWGIYDVIFEADTQNGTQKFKGTAFNISENMTGKYICNIMIKGNEWEGKVFNSLNLQNLKAIESGSSSSSDDLPF